MSDYTNKPPEWWPENPYYESAMSIKNDEQYSRMLPDPELRTAVSWYIGNRTWELACEAMAEAFKDRLDGQILEEFEAALLKIFDLSHSHPEIHRVAAEALNLLCCVCDNVANYGGKVMGTSGLVCEEHKDNVLEPELL